MPDKHHLYAVIRFVCAGLCLLRLAIAAPDNSTFLVKCGYCHGNNGEGSPTLAKALKVEIKPLSQTGADVRNVILKGQGKMRPVEGLTSKQVDSIVSFVDSLKSR